MAPFVNIHTHRKVITEGLQLIALSPEEWLNNRYTKDKLFSVGIHPWHSADINLAEQLTWLEKALLQPNVLTLGEIGLDRSINTPMQAQEAILKPQLELAKHYSKPLVFHAVRSVSDLLSLCKQNKIQLPLIFHGFTGKPETVLQIYRANGYVSFGAKIIENRSWDTALKKAYELNILFFETDDADVSIGSVYQKASEVLDVELAELKEQVYTYFCNVFGKPL